MTNQRSSLHDIARGFPESPGCYLFKAEDGRVLYVGKAIQLRSRVSSYFGSDLSERISLMVSEARTLEFIVTSTELEALMLEANLIKEKRPRYNIMLRDDKSYPYIVVTVADKYPRIAVMRRPRIKGARIYGPYTARALRRTVDFLRSIFPVCNCRTPEKGRGGRCPCLDYHIGRCMGPCLGIDPNAYREVVDELCMFLEGRRKEVIQRVERQMKEAASGLDFERAAKLRDRLRSINGMMEGQNVVSTKIVDADVIGLASDATGDTIQLLSVRDGLLIDSKHFDFGWASDEEILRSFLTQYYTSGTPIPREILLPCPSGDDGLIAEMLSGLKGSKVRLHAPVRGEKRSLVSMAEENALHSLERRATLESQSLEEAARVLRELSAALGLSAPPSRIECYDISNTQGTHSVGSMVVFRDARAHKADYRRFRIRKDDGPDDFGMMREMLERRLSRLGATTKDGGEAKDSVAPDLIVVDGGAGQLSMATSVLGELGLDIPAVGLAKREEELYLPGREGTLLLPRDSGALRLLQNIRDEAHRFAILYHRELRTKNMTRSALDSIPGIGPERRRRLLRAFSSLEELSEATEEDVIKAAGISRQLSTALLAHVRASLRASAKDPR